MHSRTGLLSAAWQPPSFVQESGSTPRGLRAAAQRAAAPFPPAYDVMRPLTRLSEPGVVRSCVYTYEQITGGNTTVMWAIEMMVIHKLTTRCIHDSSCIYAQWNAVCE